MICEPPEIGRRSIESSPGSASILLNALKRWEDMNKLQLKSIILALAAFTSVPDDARLVAIEASVSNLREAISTVTWDREAQRGVSANVTRIFGDSERLSFCCHGPVDYADML
jgi:hypothetical protein